MGQEVQIPTVRKSQNLVIAFLLGLGVGRGLQTLVKTIRRSITILDIGVLAIDPLYKQHT